MKKVLLDTDILIEHLRNNPIITDEIGRLYHSGALLAYTPISEAEIYRGLRSHEREKTKTLLGFFECFPVTREIGRLAGEYLRKYSKSHGLEIADALIAATAILNRFNFCTFNWKHFPMTDIHRYPIERSR